MSMSDTSQKHTSKSTKNGLKWRKCVLKLTEMLWDNSKVDYAIKTTQQHWYNETDLWGRMVQNCPKVLQAATGDVW